MPTFTTVITTTLLVFCALSTTKSLPAGNSSLSYHYPNEPESLLGASYTRRRANQTYRESPKAAGVLPARSPYPNSQADYSASMPYSMRDINFPSWMYQRPNDSQSGSNMQRRQPRPLSDQTNLPPPSTPSSASNIIPPNTSVTFIARPTSNGVKKHHKKTKKGGQRAKKHSARSHNRN